MQINSLVATSEISSTIPKNTEKTESHPIKTNEEVLPEPQQNQAEKQAN